MQIHHLTSHHNSDQLCYQLMPVVCPFHHLLLSLVLSLDYLKHIPRNNTKQLLQTVHLGFHMIGTLSGQKYPNPTIPKSAITPQINNTDFNLDLDSICLISYTPFGSNNAISLSITCTETLLKFFIICSWHLEMKSEI